MKVRWFNLSPGARLLSFLPLAGLISAALLLARPQNNQTAKLPCSNETYAGTIEAICSEGYALAASYDALPTANQRELFRLQKELPIGRQGFVGSVDSQGQFRVRGDRPFRTDVIVDIHEAATVDYPERWAVVQGFLRNFEQPFFPEAKRKSPKGSKPSCDPTNAWTLLKLQEEPLRRCLRTVYLLEMTNTFTTRAQKVFGNQTIKYSDGTTGPLSLKREGLNDSDRNNVVAAVKKLDKKARALGGYH